MKKLLFSCWLMLISLTVLAQEPSQGYQNFLKEMQGLIQNQLYSQVAEVIYDVEEIPSKEEYIAFCKEVEAAFDGLYNQYSSQLKENEQSEARQFGKTMVLQLGELYLERADEFGQSQKIDFYRTFVQELGLVESISSLNEDVSRAVIMGIHAALGIPFGMPNTQVISYIYSEDEPLKELFRAAYVLNEMAMLNESYDGLFAMTEGFKSDYPQSRFKGSLDATLQSLEKLKEGAQVVDFAFVDMEGNQRKLSEFGDKIIYLDLWASWCGPCINTFKTKTPDFEKKLRDQEDVVLLYVSIDEKEESWKNYLAKNPMRGEHFFVGRGFEAEIMKYFKVWGIPRYLIIGKGNKLVSPNAPRPGDEAYAALIEVLGT
jgi:thiol-disulfide isomerase/thioredoxin